MNEFLPKGPLVTRFAPTPSGLLHIGNALNFALTWWTTRKHGGSIALRIDDADRERFRVEYLEDIFESLNWMGLDWDHGPKNAKEFESSFSQSFKKERYFKRMNSSTGLYACECARKDIRALDKNGIYQGTCREKSLLFAKDKCSIRQKTDLPCGDYIVWRKDDLPSYHLTSLVDDQDLKCNFILRGEDLKESTIVQRDLEEHIGGTEFRSAKVYHHALIKGPKGEKLSKSRPQDLEAFHLKTYREKGLSPKDLLEDLFSELKINGPAPRTFGELLERTPPMDYFKE